MERKVRINLMRKRLRRSRPQHERKTEKLYRENHRELIKANRERFNLRHPGRAKELHDKWMSNPVNRQRDTISKLNYIHKRHSFLRSSSETDEIKQWYYSWRSSKSVEREWCRQQFPPNKCCQDHIVPLKRGGEHKLSNLCVSCRHCNAVKSAKDFYRWQKDLYGRVELLACGDIDRNVLTHLPNPSLPLAFLFHYPKSPIFCERGASFSCVSA